MKIGLVTIAYNQPNGIRRLFETARTGERIEFFLFLHSKIPPVVRACTDLTKEYPTKFFPYGTNRGVARSWNDGVLAAMNEQCDVVLVTNDDIWFEEGDVDKIARAAVENRDRFVIVAAGYHHYHKKRLQDHGMACYAINPVAVGTIGMFDENIFPAYLEDCDYFYRARNLAGLEHFIVSDTNVHHEGSRAVFTSPALRQQNSMTHGRNNEYYKRKWGGLNDHERFAYPFNDPKFNHYIAAADRRNPYPGYNRTDMGIVRL